MTDRDIRELQLEIGGSVFELIEFSLTRHVRGKAVKVTLATADLQEGIAAAREKRPPRFTGR